LLYTVPKDTEGFVGRMCVDPKGRLIVSDQYGKLYRIVPAAARKHHTIQHEIIDVPVGKAHGLLYAFDSLYVMVKRTPARALSRARYQRRRPLSMRSKLLRSSTAA